MIVGGRGERIVSPVSNVSMGEGELDLHRLEDRRSVVQDKKRDRDRGRGS